MAFVVQTQNFGSTFQARVADWIETARTARLQRADYARTYCELSNLSDRELMDLGFSRYDLARVAREHVYGV